MNTAVWGILAQPPATVRWWRIRLRAWRFARAYRARTEADLVEFWYEMTATHRTVR